MEIQTLKFRVNPPGAEPLRSKLECERARDLENAKGEDLPFACLVERKDLAALRQFKDLVVDRGSKNKHKGLSEYLLGLGPDKIPIIDGNYGSSRQLGRSIQAFLSRAFAKGESNLYIIGTEKTIFNELWKKAGEAKGEKGLRGRPRTEWRYSYQPQSTDISSWLLHELRAKCEPPPELSERYVGESEDAFLVRQLVILAAHSEDPVLVLGDTGTGKEVVAREIHRNSRRKGAKFITVNCSGIPRDLLESELFGHVKGAFTDAKLDKAGLWEIASGGTLFLDEIGDLHLENQAKILRALEEESIRRIGATEDIPVNARVIAATNRDLFSMVQTGEFREDLYYRLRGFLIRTLALRDHPEDIPLLAQFFWEKIARDDQDLATGDLRRASIIQLAWECQRTQNDTQQPTCPFRDGQLTGRTFAGRLSPRGPKPGDQKRTDIREGDHAPPGRVPPPSEASP
jgi:hypothetical protein